MALLPANVDFTDKDFDALRLRLQNLVSSVFPEWTDFNADNFGNILLELFAFVGDILTFYQDNQAQESRITTAQQRKNIIALAKLLGYTPKGAFAAQVDVVISLPTLPAAAVTFPAGTQVSTLDVTSPVVFQLLTSAVIPAGGSSVTTTAENSTTHAELFQATSLANQQFTLATTPYVDSSAVIAAGNGAYVQVANFLDSGPTALHFTIVVDQNDRAQVRFGNGTNGQIPTGTITVTYKTGGGAAGHVDQGTVRKILGSFTDAFGNAVAPTVTNPAKSSGGSDRESVEQIRVNAPASIRAPVNSISLEDFTIHAQAVPGVARALFLTSDQDPGVPENTGIAFPVPVGGGAPTQALKDAVLTQLTVTFPPPLTFRVIVQDPVYAIVTVSATVFLRTGQTRATVGAAIRSALAAFFAPQNADGTANVSINFGANYLDSAGNVVPALALSDVFNVVRDVPGVRKIGPHDSDFLLNGVHDDVTLTQRQFPMLGVVALVDGDTGVSF